MSELWGAVLKSGPPHHPETLEVSRCSLTMAPLPSEGGGTSMYVRTTVVTGVTEMDQGVAFVRDEVQPQLQKQVGFRGISLSADRCSGLLIVLSQWESQSALDGSESIADKSRTAALRIVGGEMRVEQYEQLMWEAYGAGPSVGCKLHIRGIQMEPESITKNFEYFRSNMLPVMKASPGILGIRFLINPKTGQGRVGTVWSDEETRAAFLQGTEGFRAIAGEQGVEFTGDTSTEILYASMS